MKAPGGIGSFITRAPSWPVATGWRSAPKTCTFQPGIGLLVEPYFTGSRSIPNGLDYLHVFRFVGTTAFMAYGVSCLVDSIWRTMPWSNTFRSMFDGLLYSLVTAGVFGWLWPR